MAHLEGVKNILTPDKSLNIHVKIFLFYVIDEMSGCLKKAKTGTETSGLWPHKTGASL